MPDLRGMKLPEDLAERLLQRKNKNGVCHDEMK